MYVFLKYTVVFHYNEMYCTTDNFSDKEVFPTLEFLGWYTIGDIPTDEDVYIHKQVNNTNFYVYLTFI